MLVYADGCGNNPIPEEWKEDGVTMHAEFMGDSFSRGHMKYMYYSKENQEVRL